MRIVIIMIALGALASWLSPAPAYAGLIITSSGGSLNAGGTTLNIPVYIASDGSDSLGQFTVVFDVKPDASNPIAPVASLEFVTPGSSATDPTLNDNSYVYNPNNTDLTGTASFKQDTNTIFGVATDPGSIGYNTQFAGSDIYDGTDNSGGAGLVSGTTNVLADLTVTFAAATTTNALGDLFDITIHLASSSFQDGAGGGLTLLSPGLEDTTISQVRVMSNLSAVPEPSTITLTLTALAASLLWKLRVSIQFNRANRSAVGAPYPTDLTRGK